MARDEFWDTPYLSDEDVTLISSGPEDEETQQVTFSVEPAGGCDVEGFSCLEGFEMLPRISPNGTLEFQTARYSHSLSHTLSLSRKHTHTHTHTQRHAQV